MGANKLPLKYANFEQTINNVDWSEQNSYFNGWDTESFLRKKKRLRTLVLMIQCHWPFVWKLLQNAPVIMKAYTQVLTSGKQPCE